MDEAPYRVAAPKPPVPPDPYLRAWRRLRVWRRLTVCSLLAWPGLIPFLGRPDLPPWILPFVLANFALTGVSGFGLMLFLCPKCGNPFHAMSRLGSQATGTMYSRSCVTCGIVMDTPQFSEQPMVSNATARIAVGDENEREPASEHGSEYEDIPVSERGNAKR
jgi:hypothetical protein